MFEFIEAHFEEILMLVGSIASVIVSILTYKRTGVLKYLGTFDQSILRQADTQKQADIVANDVKKLIEYHENTARQLRNVVGQTVNENNKKEN